jgi:choline dehydrogenase-like flavoprotein
MHDYLIVGTGPAGVSAGYALAAAGRQVLFVDGATGHEVLSPPQGKFKELRRAGSDWMFGRAAFSTRKGDENLSPKARVSTLEGAFSNFQELNRIAGEAFTVVGSLSIGGLSNAWGSGVAAYDAHEMSAFPFQASELKAAYGRVASWMGLSGACDDDLQQFFGVDDWAEPAVYLDQNHQLLWNRYQARRARRRGGPVRIGRARVAVLRTPRDGRGACDYDGMCLWGCSRGALFSTRYKHGEISGWPNVTTRTGVVVDRLVRTGQHWQVHGRDRNGTPYTAEAKRVLLAAGTLATTAIVLRSKAMYDVSLPLFSSPMGAFLLWMPQRLGAAVGNGVGFAQLSFVSELDGIDGAGHAFGNLFSTAFLPVTDFLRHAPLPLATAADAFRMVLPSAVVGNFFLPSAYSSHQASLSADGVLVVRGGLKPEADHALKSLKNRLAKAFMTLGAILVPGSFKPGAIGGDVHYAGTLPMSRNPTPLQSDANGQVQGMEGVYVVDGASLPQLPSKAHTLTIMANADRIARRLAQM